jgi:acyl-CoA dehydrogenase
MREIGLFGHSIPEAHAGAGLSTEELSLVNVEVSQRDDAPGAIRRQFGHRIEIRQARFT